jgi:adenylosuccinate synthase
VRYNGGAQAGHNVVTADGRHHTFAQFAAGSFVPGVRTFLSRHFVLHPTALLVEARKLEQRRVSDVLSRIAISEQARVITPFHQAAGRIRELARGVSRHGSCGVGVGETVKDSLEHPADTILAADLHNTTTLNRKLRRVRERKRDEMRRLAAMAAPQSMLDAELAIFDSASVAAGWINDLASLAKRGVVVSDSTLAGWMAETDSVVFEGAQGVLLDELYGFHPYTSWSDCTVGGALGLLSEYAPRATTTRIGVLRAHALRHGAGPLPTEIPGLQPAVVDHNRQNPWQGPVRYGWLDVVLARYALDVVGNVDALALTHLDAIPRMSAAKVCSAYRLPPRKDDAELVAEASEERIVTRLTVPPGRCLNRQSRLAELLFSASAMCETCKPNEQSFLVLVERLLGRRVDFVSRGPQAADVTSM